MQRASGEVEAESKALEQTMGALKTLFDDPGADLRQPFQHYSQTLDRLISAAHRTDVTGKRMAQKNAAYVAAWDKQLQTIDYEHIRKLSEARLTEVTNRFDAVNRRYQESQAAVRPLIGYLKDIRTALSADLTMAGVESLKGIVQNEEGSATKVQTALAGLGDELSNSSARLSSVAFQKPQQANSNQ